MLKCIKMAGIDKITPIHKSNPADGWWNIKLCITLNND